MTGRPPGLPDTPLTRGWRRGIEAAAARDVIRRRWRRLLLFVAVDVVIVAVVLVVLLSAGAEDRDAPSPRTTLPSFVYPGRRALAPVFERWASEYDVPVPLLEALAWRESRWDNTVRSESGAIGIGQLLPPTVQFVASELIGEPLDPAKPNDNIRLSARYLRSLIDRFGGRTRVGLAAYLQGTTSVADSGVTPQTEAYVNDVYVLRDDFVDAARGKGTTR